MPSSYARGTKVTETATKEDISKLLKKYGATARAFFEDDERGLAVLVFEMNNRRLRFEVPIPHLREFALTEARRQQRDPAEAQKLWEQAVRERWRAVLLVIKSKLVAVDSGIVSFEEEFMAHIVLPNNQTVSEWVAPQLDTIYRAGVMPELMPGAAEAARKLLGPGGR